MSASEKVDLNTVQSDVHHLRHLLETIADALLEMPYERDGKRDTELDRIAALTWIARREVRRIASDIDENFFEITSVQGVVS